MARPRTLPEDNAQLAQEVRRYGAPAVAAHYGVTKQAVYKALKDRRILGVTKVYRKRTEMGG